MVETPRESPSTPLFQRGERGVAVLMALFVAALATLIVTGLFWSQFVLLRTIENQQLVSQSRLLLRGALDWARAILREDARTTAFDSCDEPWAQRLQETRLDQLGETSALASQASMSGDIEDAQSRFNLRTLVNDGKAFEPEVEALKRLVQALELPSQTADLIAARVVQSLAPSEESGNPTGVASVKPIPLVLPQDIVGIAGIQVDAAKRLADYIVIFDEQRVPINVNTAAAEVLYARVPDLSISEAKRVVGERKRIGRFRDTADFRNRIGGKGVGVTDDQISISSRYFFVRGRVRLDRADTSMEALVKRGPASTAAPIVVLWQRECDTCTNPSQCNIT